MEPLNRSFITSQKAIKSFEESFHVVEELRASYPVYVRDIAIKRFEFTFEAVWKLVQAYLDEYRKVKCFSPKHCLREAYQAGVIDENELELFIRIVDDRNLTVHLYKEEQAQEIYEKLPAYYDAMKRLHDAIERRIT
jgi:nucleotidyltransferase substrate binding protein (TIGR01987 family)